MKVGKAELEVLLAQELGYQPSALHFSAEPVRVKGAAMSLVEMFRNVCGDIDQNRGGYVHPRIMQATEDMLKRLLLAALPHNHLELFNGRRRSPLQAIARRDEDDTHANLPTP